MSLKTTSLLVLLCCFSSCKIVKSLTELRKKEAKVHTYQLGEKEISYCAMHHLGKQEFYDDVTRIVAEHKKAGYVVFYELVSTDFTDDPALKDEIRRKSRKIKGFSGTYKENADGKMFSKYVQQPAYKTLGTDENDVRADVNYLELINEFERLYGKIVLDSTDLNTPFDVKFERSEIYSKKQYQSVIIDYRNRHLIEMIRQSSANKILVLYGEGHRKNFRKQLKEANRKH